MRRMRARASDPVAWSQLNGWRCFRPGMRSNPRVKHNSCDTLKKWAKNSCVIMVLDGTGGPFSSDIVLRRCGWGVTFLDFNDVFAQTVPRSEVYAEIQALRFARKTPLILVSDNEYFVSTAQRGRTNPVEPCSDLWHQYWVAVEYHSAAVLVMKVKSRASEWSLWSGHQPLRMYAGNEIGDRLAANGAEASGQDGAEARRHCHPAHADQYPNKSIQVSCVAVPRKRAPLEECIRLSAHEIVAGRRIGSVKCTQCLQVCGKKQLVACLLATTCVPWQAKDALFIPLLPGHHPGLVSGSVGCITSS